MADTVANERRLGLRHVLDAVAVYGIAAALVLVFGGFRHAKQAAAVILGPWAGGVMRDWQSCCAEFSLGLVPYGLGPLLLGLAVQLVVPPRTRALRVLQRLAWIAGVGLWFVCALVSYLHALE